MNAEVKIWQPLWSNVSPKSVGKDELEAIEQIAKLAGLRNEEVDTVLDVKCKKFLRVKLLKHLEYSILTYDYLFFGPMIYSSNGFYLAEEIKNTDLSKNKLATRILTTEELATLIKRKVKQTISLRERLQEAI